ncbi:MAG: hypothetical protein PWP57_1046 [Candidatus Atribacteria bacterium]|nr:hypothetical protein [Candidatus Atribacteria bacterium]
MKSYKKNLLDAVPEEGSGAFAELLKDSDSKVLRDTLMLLTKDNTESGKIDVGFTVIYPGCNTKGHSHSPKEEVYFVTEGKGIMVIDEEEFEIQKGDVVYVPFGKFHRTINSSPLPLSYVWITVEKEG